METPVLIVEDNETIRNVVIDALSLEGCGTVAAPQEAAVADVAALASARRPGMILFSMRDVEHGREFLRAYRRTPGPHVPVVAFTTLPRADDAAAQAGMDGALPKPFDLGDLYRLVKRHTRAVC